MNKFILDIGGTNIEYKVVTNKDNIRDSFLVEGMNKELLLDKIACLIDSFEADKFYVGISSPTAVDLKTGFCRGMSGIKDYENFNLYDELLSKCKTKLVIRALNDGNASLLGVLEHNYKNNKPSSAVMVSLGTGIGGAIYLDGKIFSGHDNMAGEFGYPIWANDKNISVNLSPVNVFKNKFNGRDGKEIFEKYQVEENTTFLVNEWFEELSRFLSMITMFINPEVIVFHGGVTHNKKFQDGLKGVFDAHKARNEFKNIVSTKLEFFNDDVNYGLLGAEALLDD